MCVCVCVCVLIFGFTFVLFSHNFSSFLVPNLRDISQREVNTSDDENRPCYSVIAFDAVTGNTIGTFFVSFVILFLFLCRLVPRPRDKVAALKTSVSMQSSELQHWIR